MKLQVHNTFIVCVISLLVFASQSIDAQHLHIDEDHAECNVCAFVQADEPRVSAIEPEHPSFEPSHDFLHQTRRAAAGTPTNQVTRAPPIQ